MPKRRRRPKGRYLEHRTEIRVRFSEVDSLHIVWHGHFIRYFEDGREAFGQLYGISYLDLLGADLIVPVVHASCDYFDPARYGEDLTVLVRLYQQESAKLYYYYEILRSADLNLLASGETIQAFLDRDLQLMLTQPPFMETFYEKWKDKMMVADG
jgi:acyl-CoA thioester hydrolase